MDEFPNEDEFEMMYEQEMEILREREREIEESLPPEEELSFPSVKPSTKRALDFNSSQLSLPSQLVPQSQTTSLSNESSAKKPRLVVDDLYDDSFNMDFDMDGLDTRNKKKGSSLPRVGLLHDPTLDLEQHERDQSVIQKIISERKKHLANEFIEVLSDSSNAAYRRARAKTNVYTHIPHGEFQALTSDEGKRYYLDVIEEEAFDSSIRICASKTGSTKLLSVPFSTLMTKAELELQRLANKRLDQDQENDRPVLPQGHDSGDDSGLEEDCGDDLWVQLYKPKHYLDLMSDEATNRLVLQWVKLWDKVVFGRKVVKKEDKKKKDPAKENFQSKFKPANQLVEELDEHGRPSQKVVLLCGPPGLGKTTLAHIIAQHAGYNIVEMNASDDRSVESFKHNLENATSMKSVLGKEKKPNCLIIDEIDGAPAATINYLVNFLNGKNMGKGKKKDSGPKLLQRPVICICNDLYVPSLRPLRQMALLIHFPPTLTSRLATRLFEICKRQSMRADYTVLMALCDKTENDIRSCLSILQFLRSTKNEVRLDDIDTASVGMKDYQRSLFSVWQDMFSIPRPKRRRRLNPHDMEKDERGVLIPMPNIDQAEDTTENLNSLSGRFSKMLKTTQSCGEYDKLTLGWFENYLNIKFKHKCMEPVTGGLDWAVFTDIMQKEIHHSQNWTLMGYMPYSCVSYHLLFAINRRATKLSFPTQHSECHQKLLKTQNLITMLIGEMPILTRAYASNTALVRDILPYLVYIIQPTLRPVNTHLYSAREKEELLNLVDIMIGYNLTYTQEKTIDGHYNFNLDPNIEEVVRFTTTTKQLTYTTRQLVAREIELEKLRRSELQIDKNRKSQKASQVVKEKVNEDSSAKTSNLPNHLQKLQPKLIPELDSTKSKGTSVKDPVVNLPRDFFGRVIEGQKLDAKKSVVNEIVKSDIWFKFKEGYSNAVRRPMKMQDLL